MAAADAKSTPSYFLGPTNIGFIMQLSYLWWQYQSEIPKAKLCDIGGVQYVWKINLDPRFVRNINICASFGLQSKGGTIQQPFKSCLVSLGSTFFGILELIVEHM